MQQINFQVLLERLLAQLSTVRVAQRGSFGKADSVDYPGMGGFFFDNQGNALAAHADGSPVTSQSPARADELIAAYGTGFGSTYPSKPIGFPAPAEPPFRGAMNFTEPNTSYNLDMPAQQLTLGSTILHVSFSGVASGFAGVDRIVFQLPSGMSSGTHALRLAAGVIVCPPPPLAQACSLRHRSLVMG
jgi:uncharacterized protein (TIGR03437 family)